jgi:DNA-directed RNA polymerase specialized sigma subunit
LLDEEINREIDEFAEEKHRIINEIHQLDNLEYVRILFKVYVEFKKLEEVCVDMGYSYRHITRLHGYALKSFGEKVLIPERCP